MYIWEANPTIEDFEKVDWESVINSSPSKECRSYCDLYRQLTDRAEPASSQQHVYAFLTFICGLTLNPDSTDKPFNGYPFLERKLQLEASQNDVLLGILPTIQDPELRARVADLLWVQKYGDYQVALMAVSAYLESASNLEDPVHWPISERRIRRALQIALPLGKNNKAYLKAIQHIEAILDKNRALNPSFLHVRLMQYLLDCRDGDAVKYSKWAENAASYTDAQTGETNWHRSRAFWEIAASWLSLSKDDENSRRASINAAETHIKEAEALPKDHANRATIAALHVQAGIEAYRKISGTNDRRKELHQLLVAYQKESVSDFGTVSAQIDISKTVQQAINAVKGKDFLDAIISLALLASPPTQSILKEQVEEYMEHHGLMFRIWAKVTDPSGKTKAKRPGLDSDNQEAVIRSEMLREAIHHQGLIADGIVRPAITQIISEHQVDERDLLPILINNPFVPQGREMIFARGLYYGLQGDVLVSTHLLIPQIENSLRYILQSHGHITSGLDHDQIQDEYTLQRILYEYRKELEQILGEDILFDLQGLLVERFGSNLRNLVAHGLLDGQHFLYRQTLYLWWLTLRLCCLPIYTSDQTADEVDSEADACEPTDSN